MNTTTVYLLHFTKPIAPGKHICQHYMGSCIDLAQRLDQHRSGQGSRLCQVAKERGIDFVLVRTWKGNRQTERKLKKTHNSPRFCPICNQPADQLSLFFDFELCDVPEMAF